MLQSGEEQFPTVPCQYSKARIVANGVINVRGRDTVDLLEL
jgi:hypothetical protein